VNPILPINVHRPIDPTDYFIFLSNFEMTKLAKRNFSGLFPLCMLVFSPAIGLAQQSYSPSSQLRFESSIAEARLTSLESTSSAYSNAGDAERKFDTADEKVDFAGKTPTEEKKADGAETTDVAKELKDLQARIKKFEDKAKDADNKAAEKAKSAWDVKLGGHIQMDYITWADRSPSIVDPTANNYFSYRRLRLVADGKGYENLDFRLQMTLEPGDGPINSNASPDLKDAYLSINEVPWFGRVRLGNFFVPFSLEQVTNDTNNIFLERSIPSQGVFAVDREVGIASYNSNQEQDVTWSTGVFFDSISDTIKTRYADRQGYRLSGRGTWLPYFDPDGRHLVHTGIGCLYTHDSDRKVRLFARPQIQRGPVLIDTGDIAANNYQTGNLEFATVWGRHSIQSEAFLSQINVLTGQDVNVGGMYAYYSFFLTGENRMFERFGQHGPQFGRNKPSNNFIPKRNAINWGAWEFKTRWSYLDLTGASAGQYNDMTLGFNWYWNDRTRVMFDWIQPYTDRAARFGAIGSDIIAMRFDVNW
jgi:phosphate-selective porin OprO and OprP